MRNRYLPLAVAAVAALALSVNAVAGGDDSNPPTQGSAQVDAVEPSAERALSVLARPRQAGDALPAEIARRLDVEPPFGMNPDLSRRAIANATNSVFVLPARERVCASLTVGEGANLTCVPTDALAAGKAGAATVGLGAAGVAVYGLVPDGVDSVAVETRAGESTRVATNGNAYYTVIPRGTPLRSVRYAGPSGPVEFRIYDPAEALD